MTLQERWRRAGAEHSHEGGYVAVITALLLSVLMGLCAFAVDVGLWYVVGQQEQRAADAAALGGVTKLPADFAGAGTTAKNFSKINGFEDGVAATTVIPALDGGRPTRLRVTVSREVKNIFGPLLGIPTTTISRTAVADFGGPVPMGSPCNIFGDDPVIPVTNKGSTCAGVNGKLWASISSPGALKQNGDAYQANDCDSSNPADLCPNSGSNSEYDVNGYFYTVSVQRSMPSLTIELFDPALVNVGPDCDDNSFGSSDTEARDARNDHVPGTEESTQYVTGDGKWCTGDRIYSGTTAMSTSFSVRAPSLTPWNPLTFPEIGGTCKRVYTGFRSSANDGLYKALNKASGSYRDDIAQSFRRWSTLCTIPSPQIGDYLVQVQSNAVGTDGANAANRYSMRAYSPGDANAKDFIAISGRERMAMYANADSATTEFYLARVPTGAAGKALIISLFDVGDSTGGSGSIQILKPFDAGGSAFSQCEGTGPKSGALTSCSFAVSSSFNGKWQKVSVQIPADYTCDDLDTTKCWVRLKYPYGDNANPHDQTTWTATVAGDPVRLVE